MAKDLEVRDSVLSPQTEVILNSIADGVFTVDLGWRVTFFNRAAEKITGIPASEAIGRPCCEVFRADICESTCALKSTMETRKPVVNKPVVIFRADGKEMPISVSTALLKDPSGRIIGGVETFPRPESCRDVAQGNRPAVPFPGHHFEIPGNEAAFLNLTGSCSE